jgi:ribonuclease Y
LLYNSMFILVILAALAVGLAAGYIVKQMLSRKRLESCENLSVRIIDEAKKEAETIKKEAILQAKENLLKVKTEFEKDTRDRKVELDVFERRLRSKEENFERRTDLLSQKETAVENREKAILNKESQLNEKHEQINRMLEEQRLKLEQIAGITSEEAKNFLIQSMEAAAKRDAALMIRKIEEDARRTADKTSREIIAYAIQRYAGDYVAENTVSVVNLPNDEMKGRIIGREGRNIRAIEAATGIDLIVDDTPEAVVLSSFDPVRREVARLSLERLITDGRIHPGRIEEIVKKVRSEVETIIKETGEQPQVQDKLFSERPPTFDRCGLSDGDDGSRIENEHQGGETGRAPP